jgi:chemotaxis family two-component system response regulator Rcp1
MLRRIEECLLLYVEDDDATAYLFQMALERSGIPPRFFRVTDGEEAIAFLLQRGSYTRAPRPDLVVLDLNLPKKSGFEVLKEMKSNPQLLNISVVVFSSSVRDEDRRKAMGLGAEQYLHKGMDFDAFARAVEAVRGRIGGDIPQMDHPGSDAAIS